MANTANVFGAEESKSVLYRAGEAKVSIGSTGKDTNGNAIFLQVGIQINRQLTPIATLGEGIRWAAQPPQGQLTAQTILTENKSIIEKLAGNSCEKLTFEMTLTDAVCGKDASMKVQKALIKDGYCSQIGFTMSGQQGYISSDLVVMFTACELS